MSFQVEVDVILRAITWVIDKRLNNKYIRIRNNNQSVEQSLTLKVVQECRIWLNFISGFNVVELLWVPGLCGVEEHAISDALAKGFLISPMSRMVAIAMSCGRE